MSPKPKVLILGKLYWAQEDCDELLNPVAEVVRGEPKSREELFEDFAPGGRYSDVVAIYHDFHADEFVGHPDRDFMEHLPAGFKWFAHKGAGYDSVDVHAAKARGVGVSNTPGAVDEATATTALYLVISTMRQFSRCEFHIRAGNFAPDPAVESGARDLSGKTLGILGMGGIGLTLANYLRPFGMKLLYHNRRESALAPADVAYVPTMEALLEQVDILVLSVPLNDKTRGLIGDKEIRRMKKGSIIVNTARGPVIDEEAMIQALQDGHLASVGLDVFTKEPQVDARLIAMPQVTLLPHVGTENRDARRKMERTALLNIQDYLTKGKGRTCVAECQELFA